MHAYIPAVDARGRSAVKRMFAHAWGVPTTGGTGAAVAVLQPRAVGEGVALVRCAGRRQALLESAQRRVTSRDSCALTLSVAHEAGERAHHARVIVLCGLGLVLLHHAG